MCFMFRIVCLGSFFFQLIKLAMFQIFMMKLMKLLWQMIFISEVETEGFSSLIFFYLFFDQKR